MTKETSDPRRHFLFSSELQTGFLLRIVHREGFFFWCWEGCLRVRMQALLGSGTGSRGPAGRRWHGARGGAGQKEFPEASALFPGCASAFTFTALPESDASLIPSNNCVFSHGRDISLGKKSKKDAGPV